MNTPGGGRSFGSSNALALKQLMVGEIPWNLSKEGQRQGRNLNLVDPQPAGQSKWINDFMRLSINLMKIRQKGDDESMDCVWRLYCSELNDQASAPGRGMASTVAKINSVGFKVMLNLMPEDVDNTQVAKTLLRSLYKWENLDCESLFDKCES